MSEYSNKGFVHSIKVPRIYKDASVIVKKVVEEGGSLKDLIYNTRHKNLKGVYALVVETIKHSKELDKLLKVTKLLQKENGLQPWLARILITELLYGKKELKGESKPVQTVLSYKTQFEKVLLKEKCNEKFYNVTVKKPRYVRVNTLHNTPDEVIKIFRREGWSFLPCPTDYNQFLEIISKLENYMFTRDFHIKELLVFSSNAQFYNNDLYQNGCILLQDKASCLPAFLLQPEPNSVVLDMCAAPGMKTTHLSAIMKNKGKIYATELNQRRYDVLCDCIQKSGCKNVFPICMDALNLNGSNKNEEDLSWVQDVEYILVDPSCSGSGMVDRKNIFADEKDDPGRLKKLCRFQFKLLLHALTEFPKVRRVVYSTCSVRHEENEGVVEDVLKKLSSGGRKGVKFRLSEPLKDTWSRRGSEEYEHGRNYIFSDPEKDLTNGFFVAVIERLEENVKEVVSLPESQDVPDEELRRKKVKKVKNDFSECEGESVTNSERKKKKRREMQ